MRKPFGPRSPHFWIRACRRHENRTFLTWFALGHLANDWPIGSLWLIVPAAGIAMALSPAEVGLLFTIFNLGGALAYLPAGILADHVSNRGRLLVRHVLVGRRRLSAGRHGAGILEPRAAARRRRHGRCGLAPDRHGRAHAREQGAARSRARHSRHRRLAGRGAGAARRRLSPRLRRLARGAGDLGASNAAVMGICFFWVARAVPRVEEVGQQAGHARPPEPVAARRRSPHGGDDLPSTTWR